MHSLNRIHRDIKGANILLTDAGCVKIADFGVAAKLSNSMVKRRTVIGTPYWMAPEVASVESRPTGYDSKCDIWAVGITAIEYAELQPPLFDMDPLMALQLLGTRNYKPPTLKNRNQWYASYILLLDLSDPCFHKCPVSWGTISLLYRVTKKTIF
ncbi:unnamed protein product [Dibothriocephalus latus]|uniref:Protein kinase domain-containing protein n=1 Tax=Dibothriocephalus latus TaxID=60516 RepID=A0A3P7MEY8_DIBLA|nr:unnamed protein product [Dibothriocephalus latus]